MKQLFHRIAEGSIMPVQRVLAYRGTATTTCHPFCCMVVPSSNHQRTQLILCAHYRLVLLLEFNLQ